MARKNPVKTPPQNQPEPAEVPSDLENVLARFEGDGQSYIVRYGYVEDGSTVWCGRVGMRDLDELAIGARFGRGEYVFEFRNASTKTFAKQVRAHLHGPEREDAPAFQRVEREPAAVAQVVTAPPAPATDPMMGQILAAMLAGQTQVMTALVSNMGNKPADSGLMPVLLALLKDKPPSTPISEIIAGIKEINGLAGVGGREGSGDDESGGMLGTMAKLATAFMQNPAPAPTPPTPPVQLRLSPAPQIPGAPASPLAQVEAPAVVDAMLPVYQTLLMGAKKQGDPELFAEMIDSLAEPGDIEVFSSFSAEQIVDFLCTAGPEAIRPELVAARAWLLSVAAAFLELQKPDQEETEAPNAREDQHPNRISVPQPAPGSGSVAKSQRNNRVASPT